MRIKKILVSNFRNLRSVEISLNSRVNVFFGENAQGKTNLLETIYTLTHGKSFRTSDVENLILSSPQSDNSLFPSEDVHKSDDRVDNGAVNMSPKEISRVVAVVEKNNLSSTLQMVLTPEHKSFLINDKKVSSTAIGKKFASVLFSPESLAVIKDSDKERRDLIDELIESVFPEKAHFIDSFKKALKQRNRMLKDLKEGSLEINSKNVLYLDTLTENYLGIATELCRARIQSIQEIQSYLEEALCFILEIPAVDIAVEYVISGQKMNEVEGSKIHDALHSRWLELKTAEIKSGLSLVGPHKHDIRIIFAQKDSRFYCSQGQQRLIILAFKMAQIRLHFRVHGSYPLLLLDDVLSEIDERKRVKLIEYLEKINAQIFMTTTENTVLNYLSRDSLAVYTVEKGVIKSDKPEMAENTVPQEDMSVR